MPPTRGAAFCIGLEAFCAFAAALALGAAAAALGFVVAFVVFFNSLAALKNDKKKKKCENKLFAILGSSLLTRHARRILFWTNTVKYRFQKS